MNIFISGAKDPNLWTIGTHQCEVGPRYRDLDSLIKTQNIAENIFTKNMLFILPLMGDHLTFKTTLRGGLFREVEQCSPSSWAVRLLSPGDGSRARAVSLLRLSRVCKQNSNITCTRWKSYKFHYLTHWPLGDYLNGILGNFQTNSSEW